MLFKAQHMNFEFESKIEHGSFVRKFDEDVVKNEPMLFSCDLPTALKLGGPITTTFIRALDKKFIKSEDLIIDSRVHMLMPNWFPCIPGFHLDDVPRERSDKQPNHFNPSYQSKHAMLLINGDICPTQFALGKGELEDIAEGEKYYKVWHPKVEQMCKDGVLERHDAESNQIIYFDWNTWHQGTRAIKSGWRFFIRATVNTKRKPTNELRRQVQVYLESPMEGW
jgi:hypothetical protein